MLSSTYPERRGFNVGRKMTDRRAYMAEPTGPIVIGRRKRDPLYIDELTHARRIVISAAIASAVTWMLATLIYTGL